MSNIVAIVGRPNVGKSTFFNRMIQKREAIVDSTSGVTRDRHYGKSDWNGRLFTVNNTVTGSIFSVNDVAGLPIVEVFSDDRVVMGQYASDALVVSGSGVSFANLPTINKAGPIPAANAAIEITKLFVSLSKFIKSVTSVFNLVTIFVNAGNKILPND